MQNKASYKPVELARMYGIHPNTIRLYEKLAYISPAQRSANNYRSYTKLQVLQVKVCRYIFGYPFTNRRIRNAGNNVMWASAKQLWDKGRQFAEQYIKVIEIEIEIAQSTADILQNWANYDITFQDGQKESISENKTLCRKEVANFFGVTVEVVRNWERNGLIASDRVGENGERLYSDSDLDRMRVVYMLRQSGYSIAAIHHSISMYDKGNTTMVLSALNRPKYNDLVSVGDRWLFELSRLKEAAQKIPQIFDEIETL